MRLRFESSPSGAEVLHNGVKAIGTTPLDFQVPRGEDGIVFLFRLPGHVDVAKTVLPDQTKSVRADLNPAPVDSAGAGASDPAGSLDPPATGGAGEGAPTTEPAAAGPGTKPRPKPPRTKTGGKSGADAPAGKAGGSGGGGATPGDEPPPASDPKPQPKEPKDAKPASDLGELKNPFAR